MSEVETPCPLPTAIESSSIFPTPSIYKSFHSFVEEPKSLALSVEGIKSEANCPVTVIVSELHYLNLHITSCSKIYGS